jgi:glycosyltransferase involved in cell wall biosynthesis
VLVTVVINGRFLTNSFGGARRFAVEITERLARLRGDVLLVTPQLADDVTVPDVPHRVIGRLGGPLWEQMELPLWLRRQGAPLLLNPATIAPVAYRPQISVIHDIAPAIRPYDFTRLFRVQWNLSVRLGMLRTRQGMVTISEASRRELADHFRIDPERIEVVHLGADSLAGPGSSEPETKSDPPTFLVFGRHGAAKNIRTVIDAAALLNPDDPMAIRFIGRLDPALKPYARQQGVAPERLVWRGAVSDEELREEYARATAFIWPSLHEGFGIPPVEAQSLGLPVVASDIPINREILGNSAQFFPPTDAEALMEALTRLSRDTALRSELRRKGEQNAKKFSWDETALGWNAIIERFLT